MRDTQRAMHTAVTKETSLSQGMRHGRPAGVRVARDIRHAMTWMLLAALLLTVGAARAESMTGNVTRVVSADTYEVEIAGKPERVRLNAIAAPVRDQAGSKEARAYAVKLAAGKTVKIEMRYRDRHERIIGNVTLPDDRKLNHELVKAGHAWHYVRFAPDDTELAALEQAAREEKLGLWAKPDPVAPWDFQNAQRGE